MGARDRAVHAAAREPEDPRGGRHAAARPASRWRCATGRPTEPLRLVKASVFVGTSLDGFIARVNGDLDFLPPDGGEPHGYDEFMATVDALVMGRHTFETVLSFDAWPYGGKRVFVLSTRPLAPPPPGAGGARMSGAPAHILSPHGARGVGDVLLVG